MSFLYPTLLYFLPLVLVPVVIHFLSLRRYKRIYFSKVNLLETVQKQHRSYSRIRKFLLLFIRILIVSAIIMAFTQPYYPLSSKKRDALSSDSRVIGVFIDNSFSMNVESDGESLFFKSVNIAKEIINQHANTDRFILLTHDFSPYHNRQYTKEAAIELLENVEPGIHNRSFNQVGMRFQDLKLPDQLSDVFVISDFQKSFFDPQNISLDTNTQLYLIPVQTGERKNISIDSVWFSNPVQQLNQPSELWVRLTNYSEQKLENIPIKILINEVQKSLSSYNIDDRQSIDVPLSFTISNPGFQSAEIQTIDAPVVFDNNFFFTFYLGNNINILSINLDSINPYLEKVFQTDPMFNYVNALEKNLDYSSFSNYNLIIINELNQLSTGLQSELAGFVKDGGHLFMIPGENINKDEYKEFSLLLHHGLYEAIANLEISSDFINTETDLLKNVFESIPENLKLPGVKKYYPIKDQYTNLGFSIISLQNGADLIKQYDCEKGKVYMLASTLNSKSTNLGEHALFVPLLYKIALNSTYYNNPLFYEIGKMPPININKKSGNQQIFHLTNMEHKIDLIPEQRNVNGKVMLYVDDTQILSGNYWLTSGGDSVGSLAFNYGRSESDLNCYSENDLQEQISMLNITNMEVLKASYAEMQSIISQAGVGIKLWKYFILSALFLLGLEVIIIRFSK